MRKIQLPQFLYDLGITGLKSHRVSKGRDIHVSKAQRVYFSMKTKEDIRVWPNVSRIGPNKGNGSEEGHCFFPVKAQKTT